MILSNPPFFFYLRHAYILQFSFYFPLQHTPFIFYCILNQGLKEKSVAVLNMRQILIRSNAIYQLFDFNTILSKT